MFKKNGRGVVADLAVDINTNERYLIYGTSEKTKEVVTTLFMGPEELKLSGCIGFLGVNAHEKEFLGFPVYHMYELPAIKYTRICVVSDEDYSIQKDHLVFGYRIAEKSVKDMNWLLFQKALIKYKNSAEPQIQETIAKIRAVEDVDDFCGYCVQKPQRYQISWDPEYDMPYALFDDKRIYYPRNQRFTVEGGKQYIYGLEYEQQSGSPHQYISDEHNIFEDDVIVDAGVCEGNFAIKYVERCKKVYLIEPDRDWEYPLRLTFRNYMNKVVICRKYLSDRNDNEHITLDELLNGERIDFLKMDIEGSETEALFGAQNTFCNSELKCSICSYHKHEDEKKIKRILSSYGYSTDVSDGHMIYLHDPERFRYCEFRKGVVYGWKER